jgi:SAM-dependent methyltransferase
VNADTAFKLIALNHQFYQTFSVQFSATRQRLQPGVVKILDRLRGAAVILDLGCGNGGLARRLAQRGFNGTYVGVDFSSEFLSEAIRLLVNIPDLANRFTFIQADLSTRDWDAAISKSQTYVDRTQLSTLTFPLSFNAILAFGVLHHLPGVDLRLQLLRKVRSLLSLGSWFIHSEWQFLNSPRLRSRIQPWEVVGLTDADLETGDYLLDWRGGGHGLRYVHHFSEDELTSLAAQTGFTIYETFLSDGEGGKLGLYQVWKNG